MFDPTSTAGAEDIAEAAAAATWRLEHVSGLRPGPLAMGLLDRVDVDDLDADGRVTLLQAWERQSRWVAARP